MTASLFLPVHVGRATVYRGDCRAVLRTLPDASVDSVVTDPPYELGFMGRAWDSSGIANDVSVWGEALRVLKPGGYLLAFGGTRTVHRMVCAIEDAGFEVRDGMVWLYGSGFPKSLDVSKAIDAAAGAERERLGTKYDLLGHGRKAHGQLFHSDRARAWLDDESAAAHYVTAPATDGARVWDGWGTALKPAHEPICVARKPLVGTVAENVLEHGTGAMNIAGCKIGNGADRASGGLNHAETPFFAGINHQETRPSGGRFPANVLLGCACEGEEHGEGCAVALLDAQSGTLTSGVMKAGTRRAAQDRPGSVCYGTYGGNATSADTIGDRGGASRFFYTAKASGSERHAAVRRFGPEFFPRTRNARKRARQDAADTWRPRLANRHPTVKPVELIRYLQRLVTPPGGSTLDLFAGSGTAAEAAELEGFRSILIDLSPYNVAMCCARAKHGEHVRERGKPAPVVVHPRRAPVVDTRGMPWRERYAVLRSGGMPAQAAAREARAAEAKDRTTPMSRTTTARPQLDLLAVA